MSKRILVTSYERPDLDGVACTYAYAEFLSKSGKSAQAAIFGRPHREARFVLNLISAEIEQAEKIIKATDQIILVDTSDTLHLSKKVDPNKVIEIIDHRKVTQIEKFPNATTQIELVGAASTLIAEKFHENNVEMSIESAKLLYFAIVSNTINFKISIDLHRDIKMANWLKEKARISDKIVHEIFVAKSKFDEPLYDVLDEDLAEYNFKSKKIGAYS